MPDQTPPTQDHAARAERANVAPVGMCLPNGRLNSASAGWCRNTRFEWWTNVADERHACGAQRVFELPKELHRKW